MKRIIKLNENDIKKMVLKVINEGESSRYMFFSNLEQMKRQCDYLLDFDVEQIENILDNGHDWAQDHIAEAKNNMDQVFDFFMNEIKGENSNYSINEGINDSGDLDDDIMRLIENKYPHLNDIEIYGVLSDLAKNYKASAYRKEKGIGSARVDFMNESVNIDGSKIGTSSGDINIININKVSNYKINVVCSKFGITAYNGPISLSSLWSGKDGGIAGKDNTGKIFSIPKDKSISLVRRMKNGDKIINTEGEGTIAGISGKCKVILTKK